MRKQKLTTWIFRCFGITLSLGIAISFYFQFRIIVGIESEIYQQSLKQLAQVTRVIVTDHMPVILKASTECKRLCQELALKTQKRVTISSENGKILGDSLYGTTVFPARVAYDSDSDFYSYQDPLTGDTILSHSILVDSPSGKEKVRLHLSMPISQDWGKKSYVLQNGILAASLLLVLVFVSSKFVSQNLRSSIQSLIYATKKYKNNRFDYQIRSSKFHEIQVLDRSIQKIAKLANRNKRKLGENRTRWEAIFRSMHEGILALNHDHEILEINEAAKTFLGIPKKRDVVNKSLLEVFRSAEINTFLVALEDTEKFHETEIDIDLGSNEINTYHISGILVQFRPKRPHGLLLVFNDITRLKKLEKMRQEFIANVSHELKTPVTSIKGLVETISGCLTDDPEMARKFLERINRNTDRLNAIIDDLLHLSNLEQGHPQIEADFQLQNLGNSIRNALNTLEEKILPKKIKCKSEIEDFSLFANHRLLEQAIANLIDNAIKYSPQGSEIEITGKKMEDETYKITVRDHGKGIPPEHQERIFERFYRVDKSRDRQTGGSGLGLAIVKHIVQLHSGNISLESQRDAGSCFTVTLPIEKPSAKT